MKIAVGIIMLTVLMCLIELQLLGGLSWQHWPIALK